MRAFKVRAFEVRAFNVRAFNVRAFNVRAFNVRAFKVSVSILCGYGWLSDSSPLGTRRKNLAVLLF
ncbi:hypothetical protein KOI35_12560 [Actinoplanes bogorensis]|uniref:Pentapeptide repeat-containing protein n=1 Tax=Paractinoplanes bogorensis TaxID=1610840 RepID=A0ABS5YLL8_9ACTN|nr:hypothetical protein [Actinoplanes bogorensis]MBU2664327.1 hypothetical protein [Actinoplanes bogorensis]